VWCGGVHHAFLQLFARGGCTHGFSVQCRPTSSNADPSFFQYTLIDDTDDRNATVQHADQRPKKRFTGDETLSSVDGIEHPYVFGIGSDAPEFFSVDSMIGVSFLDERSHGLLRFAIGDRDGALGDGTIVFYFGHDLDRLSPVWKYYLTGGIG